MKKPRSLSPSISRMLQRMEGCLDTDSAAREAYYYCDGMSRVDFIAAVAAGQTSAVNHALDVLAAELWLRPRDMAIYGKALREALYTAKSNHLLKERPSRVFYDLECRLVDSLLKRAWHSEPGPAARRSQRRLARVSECVNKCFGSAPEFVEIDAWPAVSAPVRQLRKAVRRGWFSAEQAAWLAAASPEPFMMLLHAVEEEFPAFSPVDYVDCKPDTPCYFLCERTHDAAVWLVAPWRELDDLCGVVLVADAAFCYVMDDWGNLYAPQ